MIRAEISLEKTITDIEIDGEVGDITNEIFVLTVTLLRTLKSNLQKTSATQEEINSIMDDMLDSLSNDILQRALVFFD